MHHTGTMERQAPCSLAEGQADREPSEVSDTGCAVARVPLLEALGLGASAWEELHASSSAASPFAGWAWHRAWADAAPADEVRASQALLVRGPDDVLQVILPLAVRSLRFRRAHANTVTWAIGDLGCPDHLDVLAAPDQDLVQVIPALESLPWDVMRLSNLAADAPNVRRLAAALARAGYAVRRRELWGCPYVDLPRTWEDYLTTLSGRRRHHVRWEERTLFRNHTVTLTDWHPDRFEEGWCRLVALHEQRWDGAGAFRDPRVERVHRRFAWEMARTGRLWLTTLELDGEPAVVWYGVADRETVYFCQGGRDPRWKRESVGSVLTGMMIRRAIERGYRRFDFLRGEEPYKARWARTRHVTWELIVFRRGWRGSWWRALDWFGRVRAGLETRIRSAPVPGVAKNT